MPDPLFEWGERPCMVAGRLAEYGWRSHSYGSGLANVRLYCSMSCIATPSAEVPLTGQSSSSGLTTTPLACQACRRRRLHTRHMANRSVITEERSHKIRGSEITIVKSSKEMHASH
jgi:hypothetical protein